MSRRTCPQQFLHLLRALHAHRITPLSYHAAPPNMYQHFAGINTPYRVQHIKATAVWTFLAAFPSLLSFSLNYANSHEMQWHEGLDLKYQYLSASLSLLSVALLAGMVVAGIYACALSYRDALREFDRRQNPESWDEGMYQFEVEDTVPLLGSKSSSCKVSLTVPRVFLTSFIGLSALMATFYGFNRDTYEALSKSDFTHDGLAIFASFAGSVAASGIFAGIHKLGAVIHDCIDPPERLTR